MGKKKHSVFAQAISKKLHKQLIEGDEDEEEDEEDEEKVTDAKSVSSGSSDEEETSRPNHASSSRYLYLEEDERGYWMLRNPNRKDILTRENMVAAAAELTLLLSRHKASDNKIKIAIEIGGVSSGDEKTTNAVGPEGVAALFEVLLKYNDDVLVRRLKMHACQLGDLGASYVADYIRKSGKIPPEIHLSHNNISTEGIMLLVSVLGSFKDRLPLRSQDGLSICLTLHLQGQVRQCDSRHCMQRPIPHLHCPFLRSQRVGVARLVQQFQVAEHKGRSAEQEAAHHALLSNAPAKVGFSTAKAIVHEPNQSAPTHFPSDWHAQATATAAAQAKPSTLAPQVAAAPISHTADQAVSLTAATTAHVTDGSEAVEGETTDKHARPSVFHFPNTPQTGNIAQPTGIVHSTQKQTETEDNPELHDTTPVPAAQPISLHANLPSSSIESVHQSDHVSVTSQTAPAPIATQNSLPHTEPLTAQALHAFNEATHATSVAIPIVATNATGAQDHHSLAASFAATDIEDDATDFGLSPVEELEEYESQAQTPSTSLNASSLTAAAIRQQVADAEKVTRAQVYAVLDSNAVLKMLAADKATPDAPFSFLSALRTPPGRAQVQFVLLHTVYRELDGLKKDQRFRLLLSDFLRDVRTRASLASPLDGLRAKCLSHGVLVELSEEEAEMEVTYGGHYRSCDLQGPDAMILNVTWFLYEQLRATYGENAGPAVVLVTNDLNMHHWASTWHLPCTSFDTLSDSFKNEPVRDLSSASVFLKCAGIATSDDASPMPSSLREVVSHVQLRSSMEIADFLEAALPKLALLQRIEQLVQAEKRDAVPVHEIKALLGLNLQQQQQASPPKQTPTAHPQASSLIEDSLSQSPSRKQDLNFKPNPASQSLTLPITINSGANIAVVATSSTKPIVDAGYRLLDQVLAGVARTESMTSNELGHHAATHQRKPSRVNFS